MPHALGLLDTQFPLKLPVRPCSKWISHLSLCVLSHLLQSELSIFF
jgi:hypothetical protein